MQTTDTFNEQKRLKGKTMKEKLKSTLRALFLAGFAAWALPALAAPSQSADSQAQKQIPTSREVLEMPEKALGGDEFFKPKPYTLNVLFTGKDSYDGIKTVNRADTYKDGKYYRDATVLIKRIGRPFTNKAITDLNKREAWESNSRSADV